MLIVNADDFGLSATVNRAVVRAFQQELISSATVMPVMPGFEEACALVREHGLQQHVGTHMVLTAGEPLTDPIRRCDRFCDPDGVFRVRRESGPLLHATRDERDAVAAELRAQIQLCRARGLPVTHVDSHHHVHTELGLWPVVLGVARELGVPFVRRGRAGFGLRPSARLNQALFNRRLERAGLAATRHFGDIDDYRRSRIADKTGISLRDFELMTHPDLDEDDNLVDFHCSEAGSTLASLLDDVADRATAVSFSGARYVAGAKWSLRSDERSG